MISNNIIVMKVGPHSDMSLEEIIRSKQDEEKRLGVHYWGYSGTLCQPKPTQRFCQECLNLEKTPPSLVLIETKSAYKTSEIGYIKTYSADGENFISFPGPVQLQGAKFAFVAKSLRLENEFYLDNYSIVWGKNKGKLLSQHLRGRVGKAFAHFNSTKSALHTPPIKVLVADLTEPYAVWLKEGE